MENLWRQQPLSDHADVDQGNTELFLLALIAPQVPTRLPTPLRQAELAQVVPQELTARLLVEILWVHASLVLLVLRTALRGQVP